MEATGFGNTLFSSQTGSEWLFSSRDAGRRGTSLPLAGQLVMETTAVTAGLDVCGDVWLDVTSLLPLNVLSASHHLSSFSFYL